jgi:hypothetical protein
VSTERFWWTMASARLFMISLAGMPDFTRFTMSVSANTPHFAATWCNLVGSNFRFPSASGFMPTLIRHLSIVAPVPDAHLSFMEVTAVFSGRPSSPFDSRKMMIFASCPPSSITLPTSGWRRSTASVTALTSCTNRAPSGLAERAPSPTRS